MDILNSPNRKHFPGYVYLITIHAPDGQQLCKIGGTKRDPLIRFEELKSDQLEMFTMPQFTAAFYVDDVWGVERRIHDQLRWAQIQYTEVFKVAREVALSIIQSQIVSLHMVA